MTRSDDALFDPRIAGWLQDDPNTAPDDALGVVLAELPSIEQRHPWAPWWTSDGASSTMLAVVATTVAVVLIAVGAAVALNLGFPPPGVPGGSLSPSPTQPIPTQAPSQPTPAPSPSTTPAPASIEELVGTWQTGPMTLDAALVSQMDAQCLALEFMAPGVSLAAVDARGEGRTILQYARDDGHAGTCEATVQADGSTTARNIVTSIGPSGEGVPLGANELRDFFGFGSPAGASREDQWRARVGLAGAGIHEVIVEVPGHASPVIASVANGWFAVWWPIQAPGGWRIIGLDAQGQEVGTLDFPQ